jgi:tellurite resistance protein
MKTSLRVPMVPANFFGIVLGVIGLGNAWRLGHQAWGLPSAIGETFELTGSAVWLVLITLYVAKWTFARSDAIKELDHPVQCCFVGLIGVTAMLVAGAASRYSSAAATAILVVGATYTIAFGIWRTGSLWQGGRDLGHTTAVLYLPTVAGSFVAAAVLSALGHAAWGQLGFGAGMFSWIALESVLVHRLLTGDALPLGLRPTMGIQLAPPAVGAVSYLSVTQGAPDLFAHALIGYALLQMLVLLRLFPWIRKQPFGASYWGFSFGITALATAPLTMINRGESGPSALLAPFTFVLANAVIAVLSVGTLYLLLRGRLITGSAAMTKQAPFAVQPRNRVS